VTRRVDALRRIIDAGTDADDVLRTVVDSMVESGDARWAGIAFTEGGSLRLGPQRGDVDEMPRERISISYDGAVVGELRVAGDVHRDELEAIAALIAPYVLIGWDTDGEAWEP
jgi:hypothetical protein